MIRRFATSVALTLALAAGSSAHAQSRGLSPQCREAKQNATISGSAAAVTAGACFATRNPVTCAAAGVATVKFAADAHKMIRVCVPPAPPRRGR